MTTLLGAEENEEWKTSKSQILCLGPNSRRWSAVAPETFCIELICPGDGFFSKVLVSGSATILAHTNFKFANEEQRSFFADKTTKSILWKIKDGKIGTDKLLLWKLIKDSCEINPTISAQIDRIINDELTT